MLVSAALALLPFGFLYLDSLRSQIGVEDFHRAGVTGKGVIIGLAETVDLSLWDFRNPDGSTRFLRYFDKSRPVIDSLLRERYPENRYYPYLDRDSDTLRIRNYDNYHGTAVLSIAAGNGQSKGIIDLSGKYVGVAPEADLVAGGYHDVKGLADSLGRPFVYNHSYQGGVGLPADEPTSGRIAVLSSGNSHVIGVRHRFAPGDTQAAIFHFRPKSRAFHRVDDSTYLFDVLFRIRHPDTAADSRLDITLRSPNDTVLRYRVDPSAGIPIDDTVRGRDSEDYYGTCSSDTLPLSEAVHIGRQDSFRWVDQDGRYGLRYRVRTRAFKDFSIAINRVSFQGSEELVLVSEVISSNCLRYIQAEEFRDTLKGTMGMLASSHPAGQLSDLPAIHVGAYARHANSGYPDYDPLFQRAGDIAYYSGRGDFARFGVVKPDIAAPAHTVMALGSFGPGYWTAPGGDSIHTAFDGTSAAAPVVSGVVALLLQMDPKLNDVEIKSILRENARTDAFTGAVPNDNFGYGKLYLDWNKVRTRLGYVASVRLSARGRLTGPFPNPFRSRTRLEYSLPEPDPAAILEIRDLGGRLLHRSGPAVRQGLMVWDIDAAGWPAGLYAFRLHTRLGDRQGKLFRME